MRTRQVSASAIVRVRPTWRMNASSGCAVDPRICTRRDARWITKHGVHRQQAAASPDFGREKVGAGNYVLVGTEEGPPCRRPVRNRREPVGFEDARNRRPPYAMPDILQRTLDPRVAPGGVVLRHPHDQT